MAAAVPFAMKAAPYLAKAGAGLLGGMLGKKLSQPNAQQQAGTASTQQAMTDLAGSSGALRQEGSALRAQGGAQTQQGAGTLASAADYYRQVLGRGRGATEAAMAPERGVALDYYRGAENRAGRTLRGPQRDTAVADLQRQKVGQLADMTGRARTGAVSGMAGVGAQQAAVGHATSQVGANLTGQGTYANVNQLYGSQQLYNQGQQQRENEQGTGKNVGGFIFDIINSLPRGGGGRSVYGSPAGPGF